jgi:hypothetical protein
MYFNSGNSHSNLLVTRTRKYIRKLKLSVLPAHKAKYTNKNINEHMLNQKETHKETDKQTNKQKYK